MQKSSSDPNVRCAVSVVVWSVPIWLSSQQYKNPAWRFVWCHAMLNFAVQFTKVIWGPITRSRDMWKPLDMALELFNRSEIWQASRQRSCRDACQIKERYWHFQTQSQGLEPSRHSVVWRQRVSIGPGVYPMKYAYGIVVLCIVVVIWSILLGSFDAFTYISHGCVTDTRFVVRLHVQWSKPNNVDKTGPYQITIKDDKAQTMGTLLGKFYEYSLPHYGDRKAKICISATSAPWKQYRRRPLVSRIC